MKGLKPMVGAGIACLSLGVLVPVVPAGAQSLAHHPQVGVLNLAGHGVERPSTLPLGGTILDGSVTHLVWTTWGSSVAIGRGTRTSCPTGTFASPPPCGTSPTQVTLSHPIDTTDGWLFDQVTYRDETRGHFGRTTAASFVNELAPASLVILPTAGDVTGNYLWAGTSGVGTHAIEWLEIVQDGESVAGTLDITQTKPFIYDAVNVSGVNIHGTVSVAISGGLTGSSATSVLKFSDGDLLVTGNAPVLFVPASLGSYYALLQSAHVA
jgi:hypothetical protein